MRYSAPDFSFERSGTTHGTFEADFKAQTSHASLARTLVSRLNSDRKSVFG